MASVSYLLATFVLVILIATGISCRPKQKPPVTSPSTPQREEKQVPSERTQGSSESGTDKAASSMETRQGSDSAEAPAHQVQDAGKRNKKDQTHQAGVEGAFADASGAAGEAGTAGDATSDPDDPFADFDDASPGAKQGTGGNDSAAASVPNKPSSQAGQAGKSDLLADNASSAVRDMGPKEASKRMAELLRQARAFEKREKYPEGYQAAAEALQILCILEAGSSTPLVEMENQRTTLLHLMQRCQRHMPQDDLDNDVILILQ